MNKLIFIFSIIICLIGCNEVEDSNITESVNLFIERPSTPKQKFSLKSNQDSVIIGTRGTIIYYEGNILESENGIPINGDIELELIELSNQKDFAINNIGTTSNGELLVSGGAYFIGFNQKGKKLQLKKDHTLKIQFPMLSEEEMNIFYGEFDSLNQINWEDSNIELSEETSLRIDTTFIIDSLGNSSGIIASIDTIRIGNMTNTIYEVTPYEPIKLPTLGWINCDRFLNSDNRTNLIVEVKNQEFDKTETYLIFKDINSVMLNLWKEENFFKFNSIPTGYDVRLITLSKKGDDIFAYKKDFSIDKDMIHKVELKKIDKEELETIFEI